MRDILASIFHILEFLPLRNEEDSFLEELEKSVTSNEALDKLLDFKEYFAIAKIFKLATLKGLIAKEKGEQVENYFLRKGHNYRELS